MFTYPDLREQSIHTQWVDQTPRSQCRSFLQNILHGEKPNCEFLNRKSQLPAFKCSPPPFFIHFSKISSFKYSFRKYQNFSLLRSIAETRHIVCFKVFNFKAQLSLSGSTTPSPKMVGIGVVWDYPRTPKYT